MTAPPTTAPPVATAAVRPPHLSTRPWWVDADGYAGILRTLRFGHFKWDTFAVGENLVLPEAIVLGRHDHEEIVRIVESLNAALRRFESRVRGDREALRRLAVPDALHDLVAAEEESPLQLARYDLFPCDDGRWMVSEFNEDVPGGFNEAVIPDLLGEPGDGARWEGDLRASFVDAFSTYDRVALLYATAFSEDLQHVLILERWLAAAGHDTILGSPAHLGSRWGRPAVLGARVDAAFRFFPGEWMPRLPNLAAWRRFGPRFPMMNPVHRLTRQSKSMFALWRDERYLDDADRDLVDRHVPLTRPFDPVDRPALRDERERWVLKRAFGRMGDAVTIGALCSDAEWSAALDDAARAPGEHCVQERFVTPAVDFRIGPLFPAIGAFVVNGRFAGYYSRAARRPLITHEAFHVATLVETA